MVISISIHIQDLATCTSCTQRYLFTHMKEQRADKELEVKSYTWVEPQYLQASGKLKEKCWHGLDPSIELQMKGSQYRIYGGFILAEMNSLFISMFSIVHDYLKLRIVVFS